MVAIVIPVYKTHFTADEEISFNHLAHFLPDYKKILLLPESLSLTWRNAKASRFADHFFESVSTYSQLLLSREFYERFSEDEYILIYQPDCLVFADQLIQWCQAGYDYIGAPLPGSKMDAAQGLWRVGNGGFSLRKVSSFLRVLDTRRSAHDLISVGRQVLLSGLADLRDLPPGQRWLKTLRVLRDTRMGITAYAANYSLNEDLFWSDRARLFDPIFKIAPVREALRFAFEIHPRLCFEMNDRQLPFGCHAWTRWDREFWEPYLLS